MTTQLTRSALHQAVVERQPKPGLIHHSDRGVQYASREYVEQLQKIGAHISMSAVGNPYDNAKAESFFKTLKQEEVYLKDYDSFADVEQNLTIFIEKVYNEKKLHSSWPKRFFAFLTLLYRTARSPMYPPGSLPSRWRWLIFQRREFFHHLASGQPLWQEDQVLPQPESLFHRAR